MLSPTFEQIAKDNCQPCRVGAPPLSERELAELLALLPNWQLRSVDGIKQLYRVFSFTDFVSAQAFANQLGELAETHQHHPAIFLEWGRVTVSWWTHTIKGLHRNDFVMAAKTEQL